jgi:hypothetical protein
MFSIFSRRERDIGYTTCRPSSKEEALSPPHTFLSFLSFFSITILLYYRLAFLYFFCETGHARRSTCKETLSALVSPEGQQQPESFSYRAHTNCWGPPLLFFLLCSLMELQKDMDAIQLSRRPHSSSFQLTQKPLDRCTILYTHSVPTLNVQVLSVHFVAGRVEPRGTCC